MVCRFFPRTLLALLLCCCSAPPLDSHSLSSQDTQGDLTELSHAAFDEHVRPALSLCAGCHGKTQAPPFMVEDTATAHDAALSNVDFDNIEQSNFLKRIVQQKHNCGDCAATGEQVRAALTKWQEIRSATGGDDDIGDKTQQISFPVRTQKMQWDIGKFIGEEYSGGSIMLSVRVLPDSSIKRYSLANLSVYTDKTDIYIKGIKPLINDKWNSKNAAYNDIACAVKSTAKRPTGHIIHATGTSIVPDDFSANNKLSFALAELRLAKDDDPSCWSDDIHKDVFTHSIRPIMVNNCEKAGCHGSDNPADDFDLSSYKSVMDKTNTIKAILEGENDTHNSDVLDKLDDDAQSQLLEWLKE